MAKFSTLAKLSSDDLDALEEDLFDIETQDSEVEISRGASSSLDLQGYPPSENTIAENRREIIGIYRHGINIASSIEATPLLALLEEYGNDIPPKLRVAQDKGYAFYRMDMVFSINLPKATWPEEAEFAVEFFNQNSLGSFPVNITNFFPQELYEERIKAEASISVGLTGDLEFSVPDDIGQQFGVNSASAGVVTSASLAFAPINYKMRRARIRANGLNTQRVQWHYCMSSELSGQSEFQSWVIVKVPESMKQVVLEAQLGVLPYKKEWLVFRKQLKTLHQSVKLEVSL